MRTSRLVIIACGVALTGPALIAPLNPARAASTCSGQYQTCFTMCVQYGFGRHRADRPHPQSPEACRNHCIGWKNGCLQTGCWKGDLVQLCGLGKR